MEDYENTIGSVRIDMTNLYTLYLNRNGLSNYELRCFTKQSKSLIIPLINIRTPRQRFKVLIKS